MCYCSTGQQAHLILIRIIPEPHPQVWYIRLVNVITLRPGFPVVCCHPVLLTGVWETAVQDTVTSNLTQISAAQLPHLCCYRVLLYQWFLSEVYLQGIISAEAHTQTTRKECGEGVLVVVKEQAVVGQGTAKA
eukprot:GHUV01030401.1.p1 GENE.GHUV01030401.1~~GHUV01030401.1.p1  ORF type:complete len:133 (-),score=8.89 GHUV01030401.1:343-741(-)